jgi:hypothetical protein
LISLRSFFVGLPRSGTKAARQAMAIQLKSLHAAFVPERGRPTKKDRREINRLKGREQ